MLLGAIWLAAYSRPSEGTPLGAAGGIQGLGKDTQVTPRGGRGDSVLGKRPKGNLRQRTWFARCNGRNIGVGTWKMEKAEKQQVTQDK
jgi:hypothetical protein